MQHSKTATRLVQLSFFMVCFSLAAACAAKPQAITIPPDYTSWNRADSDAMPLNYAIPGHGEKLRKIYVNSIAWTARQQDPTAKAFRYPDGSMIIKEVYAAPSPAAGEKPSSLTIMVKQSNDPRSRGGWLWLVHSPVAGTQNVLESEFCLTCHANANEQHPYGDMNPEAIFRDYVFFPGITRAALPNTVEDQANTDSDGY